MFVLLRDQGWLDQGGHLTQDVPISFPFMLEMLVIKLCPALFDPMNCSMPGFPVLHYLPEFAQYHGHWVSDGIQPL